MLSKMAVVGFCATRSQSLSEKCALYRIREVYFLFFLRIPYKSRSESPPAFLPPPKVESWELQYGAAYCGSVTYAKRSRMMESGIQKV